MHDQIRPDMREVIDSMSEGEKLELIEQVAHSLRAGKRGTDHVLTAEHKQKLLESVRAIASLPLEGPGGFSGRDHDEVLYGSFQQRKD